MVTDPIESDRATRQELAAIDAEVSGSLSQEKPVDSEEVTAAEMDGRRDEAAQLRVQLENLDRDRAGLQKRIDALEA